MNLFERIAYIYTGTSDYAADRRFYKEILGARLVWEFDRFGAQVAAFDLCGEPYLLLADHVKAPSKRLIFEVSDLDAAIKELKGRGWEPEGSKFEIPDGPCINFEDASGNLYALLQLTRPRLLENQYKPQKD